jgi:hypothetical protein
MVTLKTASETKIQYDGYHRLMLFNLDVRHVVSTRFAPQHSPTQSAQNIFVWCQRQRAAVDGWLRQF